MSKPIRLGLYGCNMYRTRDLLAGARAAAGDAVRVVASFDIDAAKARHAAENYGGRAFATVEDFLACDEVDVVLISLPAYLHAEAYARTARAGREIYLEKPICVNADGRALIVETAKAYPVRCYVGLSYRYVAPFRKAAEILRRPEAGRIVGAHHHWMAPPSKQDLRPAQLGWRQRFDQSGGQLVHHCCHLLDWFHWIGGPMANVTAASFTPSWVQLPHEECELTAAFAYRDGGQAVFNLSQHSHHYVQFGVVHAENLSVEYQWGRDTFVRVYSSRHRAADETHEWTLTDKPGDGGELDRNTLQMADFIEAYRSGAAMPLSIHDGLRVYDYATATRRSYGEGRRVDLTGAGEDMFSC